MGVPKPTPEEFRNVADDKKLDILAKYFLLTCTDKEVFIKNKAGKMRPCSDYYGIKRWWGKAPIGKLLYLYDYLYSLPLSSQMTLNEFYQNAETYRKELLVKLNKANQATLKIEKYEEISLEDVMRL